MKKVLFSLVAMLLLSVSGIAQTTYTKITSASELEAGAQYIIVGYDDVLGYCAMSYQKTSNRHAIPVTEDGGSITVTPATDPTSQTEVYQMTLGGNTGAWTFFDELKNGYLYASSSSNNQLKTQNQLDDNGRWSIEFNADGTAVVAAQGDNTRNYMRFNENSSNGDPLFNCYKVDASIQVPVSLYKAGGATQSDPEPSNYPTRFEVLVDGVDAYVLWEDATGEQLPSKYLVLASTGSITVPTDGTPVSDSDLAKNVPYGERGVLFSGLEATTTYHFAIFPYTNSGANIDYKTDGTYPTATVTTEQVDVLLFEDFDEDLGLFMAYNAYGDQEWHQATHQASGTTFANMNGYADGADHQNEDWLISHSITIPADTYEELDFEFRTAMKFDGPALQVKVSMDYDGAGEPSDFEWEDITDAFDFSTGNYEWVESGTFVIDDVIPGKYYFAFVYTSTDDAAASWEIDYVKLTGKALVSVNENQVQAISLYPNPANEQVSFVLDSDAQVSVFDMTGRKVSEMNAAAGNVQLSVNELESGVYFVNFRYANGSTAVSKFVKF